MANQIKFNEKKFRELLMYVAERSRQDLKFGQVKLNKILYFIDFAAYGTFGKPMTGATYQHLAQGPAARQLPPLQRDMTEGEAPIAQIEHRQYFNRVQHRLVPLRGPDMSAFSKAEIDLANAVIEELWPYDATEISDLSHRVGLGWRLTEEREDIPYEWVFLSSREPTEYEVRHGLELAEQHGWLATPSR